MAILHLTLRLWKSWLNHFAWNSFTCEGNITMRSWFISSIKIYKNLQSVIVMATRRPRSGTQNGSRIYQLEGGGELMEFNAEFKFAKIQNCHVEGGGGGLMEFDAEFKFAKIQNSYVGGGGWWNQLSTFDAEFKFAKIQNSYVRWGEEGGGVGGTNFQLLMLSPNLLKKKKKICEKFSKFLDKNWNGFCFGLWVQSAPYTKYRRTTKKNDENCFLPPRNEILVWGLIHTVRFFLIATEIPFIATNGLHRTQWICSHYGTATTLPTVI